MKKAASQKARINSREDRIVRYSIYEFIASVHARPHLWDRQHSDYHNREKREQTWLEVAKRLHPKFDAMPSAEKQKTVMLLAKRWKNTRDSFFRAQRRHRSQKHQDESKAYIYERELRFLTRDSKEGVRNTNNVSSQEESEPSRVPEEDKGKIEDEEKTAATTSGRTVKKRRKATAAARPKRRRATTTIAPAEPSVDDAINESQPQQDSGSADDNALAALMTVTTTLKQELVENNPASTEDKSAAESEDPDQSFFDSIKPVVRNMSMDQRLDFQIEVLKLLKDFRGKH